MKWDIALATIKVGPKQRLAVIPDEWELVTDGVCIAGDMFANTTNGKFQLVETDDVGIPSDEFDALIRKKK